MSSHETLGISARTPLIPPGSTSAAAEVKSTIEIFIPSRTELGMGRLGSMLSFQRPRHFIAASLHSAARSAPANPCVMAAILSTSTSPARGIFFICTVRMSLRALRPGIPISISLSNLPGLLKAGSMASSLFVAAITMTFSLLPRPSMRVRSCATTLLSASPPAPSRFGAMESISSRNMMLGALAAAALKRSLSFSSLSPWYWLMISGPRTEKSDAPDSFAMASAIRVFPVPGGPYRRTPLGAVIPSLSNSSGCFNGSSTASLILFISSSSPPTSS